MTQPQREGFTGSDRSFMGEEELHLTSVGVDIGSSTSHLVFSALELERRNTRYVIVKRTIIRESDILLTPYVDDGATIDAAALGAFIDAQYRAAGLRREQIDTGALILTGVAVRRHNARAIAELFAQEAGKFVAVSAGDGLEAAMAAHGSGAVAESEKTHGVVMNIDIGGGTSKIAVCQGGKTLEVTALDAGARLLAFDENDRIVRIEDAGRFYANEAGVNVELGATLSDEEKQAIAGKMVDRLMEVVLRNGVSDETRGLLRLPELSYEGPVGTVIFSGGVSGVRLRLRPEELRRPRPAVRPHDAAARRRTRRDAHGARSGHPRHGRRRVAVHRAGERQHHLHLAHRVRADPQHPRDDAGPRPLRRRTRLRRNRKRGDRGAHAARPPRRRHGGRHRLPVGRFGHLPPAGTPSRAARPPP